MINQTLHNRYVIAARIGKGAMGTVYRATDKQTGQEMAVKAISRDLALDAEMLERFRREGEALRQLRHPNIVGFVEMFQHESQHVIVMEYVSGGSLHELIKKGPLPVDRARKIALGLCDALTRAHDLNIIHRDIKPENILMAADGTPKLTDFGVARLVSEGTRLTGTGMQVGTPYYMSPEAPPGYMTRLDAPGSYALSDLPPGEYSVGALMDCNEGPPTSGDVSGMYGRTVTVAAGLATSGIDFALNSMSP